MSLEDLISEELGKKNPVKKKSNNRLDKLVENFLKPKREILEESLENMIDNVLNESIENTSLPVITEQGESTENITKKIMDLLPRLEVSEKLGVKGTVPRQAYERYFKIIIESGSSLQERIKYLEDFVSGEKASEYDLSQILSSLTFIYLLSDVIEGFSASASGFIFEGWMAAMTLGEQHTERDEALGGTLPIQDYVTGEGIPISLKLLTTTTNVHGSVNNIIEFLAKHPLAAERGIVYLVTYKFSDKRLGFYEFDINTDNIFEITNIFTTYATSDKIKSKAFDMEKLKKKIAEWKSENGLLSESEEQDDFLEYKKFWKKMGYATGYDMSHLDPESDEMSEQYISNFGRRKSSKTLEYIQTALGGMAKEAWDEFEQMATVPQEYSNERLMELYTDYEKTKDENLLNLGLDIINARRNYVYEFIKSKSEKDPLSYTRAIRYVNSLDKMEGDDSVHEFIEELKEIAKKDLTAWGNILISSMKGGGKTQWSVSSEWVRESARRLGTLDFGDDWLSVAVDRYSEILEDKFVPVYEELANITGFINEYYLEGKVESGLKAADSARQFEQRARDLIGPKQMNLFENDEE